MPPAAAINATSLVGRVFSGQPIAKAAEAHSEGDQRRLRAEDEAEAERRQRGEQDARELDRLGRSAPGLEAVSGHVTPATGQAQDRERGENPARASHGSGHHQGTVL